MFRRTGIFAFFGALLWLLLLALGGFGLYQMGFANGYNRAVLAIQEGGAVLISPFSGVGGIVLAIGLALLALGLLSMPFRMRRRMQTHWQHLSPEQREAFHKKWQVAGYRDWMHGPHMHPPVSEAPEPEEA